MRGISAVIAFALAITGGVAYAEPEAPGSRGTELRPSYLYDGGAIPLFWLPALGAFAVDHWAQPRATPLYFDPHDGGAPRASWEIPAWTLHIAAGGLGLAMIAHGDDARWYHVKGLAEAMATSSLVVSVLKPLVGRHRPDWTIDSTDRSRATSFPSGHTTNSFLVATYAALYLNSHVFDGNTSALLKGAAYGGLFLGASMVAGERVYHERHHISDVMVGALIGTASSYTMFRLQESRYKNRGNEENPEGGWHITPGFSQSSATIGVSGAF